jgi:hypothetical protein
VDRPSGAIEDGIVSSTADPAEGREFGGGKTVPPGDAKPVLPPYDRRKESTAGGTPGRGDNEVAGNTGPAARTPRRSLSPSPAATKERI